MTGSDPEDFVSVAIAYDPETKSVLLQHRDQNAKVSPNQWGLFGGHGEKGESPAQALLRELEEEIGIRLTERDVSFAWDYWPTAELRRYVFLTYALSSNTVIHLREGEGFQWVPLDRIGGYHLTERARKDIERFIHEQCDA